MAATGDVVTVNVAVVAPAGTVTLAGTVAAAVLLLDRMTRAPPTGACAFNVTVPVEEIPPVTLAGLKETDCTDGGLTVSVPAAVPLKVAVIIGVVTAATITVFTEKVAVVAPPRTVTLPGTVATALSLESPTRAPPAGAGPFSVTVPVEEVLPVTLEGLKVTRTTEGGFTVSVTSKLFTKVAVTVALAGTVTTLARAENVAEELPAITVTFAGTEISGSSLATDTETPPAGAGPVRVTVPVWKSPPTTEVDSKESEANTGAFTVSVVVAESLKVAVMVAVTVFTTALVFAVKLAVVWPASTVTDAGTVTAALSLESVTVAPPVAAGLLRVTVPVEEVRKELLRILESSGLWDRKAWGLQVTDATERTLQLRALMSAADSSTAWDLRCHVRERLAAFLADRYPQCLPTARMEVREPASQALPAREEGRRSA